MFSANGLHRPALRRCFGLLLLVVFVGIGIMASADDDVSRGNGHRGTVRADTTGYPTEIVDPFFGIFVEMADIDSIGFWDTAALQDYESRYGNASRLPMGTIESIERRVVPEDEVLVRRGVRSDREIIATLGGAIKLPMPYSILGYHPGSLHASRRIVLREWHVSDTTFRIKSEDEDAHREVLASDIQVFTVTEGWIVLDVDMWLDRILGGKLDDSWSAGFVSTRAEDRLFGLVLALNRKDRFLYGEFDFAEDKVMPHGRPIATSLAAFIRPWVQPTNPDGVWKYEEAE